ncbi:hypothetical protein OnM2_032087 [Erysiphe neolycopersici]|uniref:Uncharacterized protein n=1 Tax=Erysiphe neolycopersici TaxID=212602 RepID=A0A420HYM9_9PEZI|nr:hypothetical protein OnM2_032087 [Erysiphe neolycopersici]
MEWISPISEALALLKVNVEDLAELSEQTELWLTFGKINREVYCVFPVLGNKEPAQGGEGIGQFGGQVYGVVRESEGVHRLSAVPVRLPGGVDQEVPGGKHTVHQPRLRCPVLRIGVRLQKRHLAELVQEAHYVPAELRRRDPGKGKGGVPVLLGERGQELGRAQDEGRVLREPSGGQIQPDKREIPGVERVSVRRRVHGGGLAQLHDKRDAGDRDDDQQRSRIREQLRPEGPASGPTTS